MIARLGSTTDDIAGQLAGDKCGVRAFGRADALLRGLAKSPDLSGDGNVNAVDLRLLLGAWTG